MKIWNLKNKTVICDWGFYWKHHKLPYYNAQTLTNTFSAIFSSIIDFKNFHFQTKLVCLNIGYDFY